MAFPTLTTCTKCGKPASMMRTETLVLRPKTVATMEIEEAKLGYIFEVACPHCGFSFTSSPSRSRRSPA